MAFGWGPAGPDRCTCGVPNRAHWHVHVVIGREIPGGTDTSEVDVYVCDEHLSDDIASLLAFDGAEQWTVIESTLTRLR